MHQNQLIVLHRPQSNPWLWSSESSAANSPWVVWSTCLRQVAFGTSHMPLPPLDSALDQVLTDQSAYQLILELACGMHSPVLAETEVFGQFKKMVATVSQMERPDVRSELLPWLRQAIVDVKEIRHRYLKGSGSQSYGSLVRREIQGASALQVVGGGHLVKEMLPWLIKSQVPLSLHLRDPKKLRFKIPQTVSLYHLQSTPQWRGVLILAAPLESYQMMALLSQDSNQDQERGGAHIEKIIDLRGESSRDPLICPWPVITLASMTHQLKTNTKHLPLLKEKVQMAAHDLAHQHWIRAKVRPQGWEDICA